MVDKTELPKLGPRLSKEIPENREPSEVEENDSEYEIPVYPPMRKIDPNLTPKKTSMHMSKGTKGTKIRFDGEVTFFDALRNGEIDLVKQLVTEKKCLSHPLLCPFPPPPSTTFISSIGSGSSQ